MKENFLFDLNSILTRKERYLLSISLLISILIMLLEGISVMVIPILITNVIESETNKYFLNIQNYFPFFEFFFESFNKIILLIFIIFALKTIINYFHHSYDFIVLKRIRLRISDLLFNKLINSSLLRLQKTTISTKIWYFLMCDNSIALISFSIQLIKSILICSLIFIIIILNLDINLLYFFTGTILIITLFYTAFNKKIISAGKITNIFKKEKIQSIQETFLGIKEIIIYRKKNFFKNKFNLKNIGVNKYLQQNHLIAGIPSNFLELVGVIFIIAYIKITLTDQINQTEFIYNIGLISFGSLRIVSYFKLGTYNLNQIKREKYALATLKENLGVLKSKSEFSENTHEYNSPIENNAIEIKNVSFKYNDKVILNNINYNFEKNKFYVICGESGSGKSTLLDLIINVKKSSSGIFNFLHSQNEIGYVSQESFLLEASLKNNIAFGEYENEINEERIKKVLSKVNLESIFKDDENSLNKIIEQNGTNLSVGQKQRIGIARALYFKPKIILLDEPTSALDKENSELILNLLKKLSKECTIIMVSHKELTFDGIDKVLELKNCKLTEL